MLCSHNCKWLRQLNSLRVQIKRRNKCSKLQSRPMICLGTYTQIVATHPRRVLHTAKRFAQALNKKCRLHTCRACVTCAPRLCPLGGSSVPDRLAVPLPGQQSKRRFSIDASTLNTHAQLLPHKVLGLCTAAPGKHNVYQWRNLLMAFMLFWQHSISGYAWLLPHDDHCLVVSRGQRQPGKRVNRNKRNTPLGVSAAQAQSTGTVLCAARSHCSTATRAPPPLLQQRRGGCRS